MRGTCPPQLYSYSCALTSAGLQGSGRSFTLAASTAAQDDAECALAAMAPHAGCQQLELDLKERPYHFKFKPSKQLPSLPHVRRMRVRLQKNGQARFSLPMPRLEQLTLPEAPSMPAPEVSYSVVLQQAPMTRHQPFPALRRLSVATKYLSWDISTSELRVGMLRSVAT